MRRLGFIALAGLLELALFESSAAGEVVRVTISNLAFSPAEIHAKAGDTIEWVNGDFIDHTATEKGGAWDVTIVAGASAELQLTRTGTFSYYCRVHPGMTGTIHVLAE
jgi:plastocyanin